MWLGAFGLFCSSSCRCRGWPRVGSVDGAHVPCSACDDTTAQHPGRCTQGAGHAPKVSRRQRVLLIPNRRERAAPCRLLARGMCGMFVGGVPGSLVGSRAAGDDSNEPWESGMARVLDRRTDARDSTPTQRLAHAVLFLCACRADRRRIPRGDGGLRRLGRGAVDRRASVGGAGSHRRARVSDDDPARVGGGADAGTGLCAGRSVAGRSVERIDGRPDRGQVERQDGSRRIAEDRDRRCRR